MMDIESPIDSRDYARIIEIQHESLLRSIQKHLNSNKSIVNDFTTGRPRVYYILRKDEISVLQRVSGNKNVKKNIFYIVFNKATQLYKIGITNNYDRRIRAIETQAGVTIEPVIKIEHGCPSCIESAVKKEYKTSHRIGEWYSFSPRDISNIRMMIEKC